MTIKIQLFYSFLVHAILLTYLFSLPIYKGSFNLKSYGDYFVYLRNEEGENAGKPLSVFKKSEAGAQDARDAKTVIETKGADEKEGIDHFEEKKAAATEVESGLKMGKPAEEKVARAIEVKEPSEPEKALKEEALATPLAEKTEKAEVSQIESGLKKKEIAEEKVARAVEVKEHLEPLVAEKTLVTKKEVHKTKEPEIKEATMKTSLLSEEIKEALPQEATGISLEAVSDNEMVSSKERLKEETIHVKKAEEAVVSEIKSGLKKKEPAEEKVARAVEVKEPVKRSSDGKALKEEAPAEKAKNIEAAKKQAHKAEALLAKKATVKETTFPAEKTERVVKPQMKKNGFDTASLLKEKGALEKIPSGTEEATKKPAPSALPEKYTEGLKEETAHIGDEGGLVAEILTSEKNRMPSKEDYFLKLNEKREQSMAEVKPEVKEESKGEWGNPPSGIPISNILFLKDIKIEVFLSIPLPRATEIIDISLEESADVVYVRIKGNGLMRPNIFPLDNRIIIDIPDVVMNALLPSVVVSPLKGIRSGKYSDKIRLVFDLEERMVFDASSTGDSIIVAVRRLKEGSPLSTAQKPGRKIETTGITDADMSNVSVHLLRKAHPMAYRKNASEKQKEVDFIEKREVMRIEGTIVGKRLISITKAEKGIYNFIIKNEGKKAYNADVVFSLFEGKPEERIKEFKSVELSPDMVSLFKFILPEAVFWDDEYYFTGTIESSNTLTKFNEKTGLIWKEQKDY